ncbi:MAG: response regulator [Solirubrobacteraceae bacterium]
MRRILVVDDSLLIREAARVVLESDGEFAVRTAENGAVGLDAALAERPDAILLDVVMPGIDGPATLQALRARPETRDIPVVLVTGLDDDEDRRAFAALDVAGVIAKPFDPGALTGQVRDALGWGA